MIAMIAANKYNLKKMHAISHFATPRAAKICHVRLDTDSPLCPACLGSCLEVRTYGIVISAAFLYQLSETSRISMSTKLRVIARYPPDW